MTHNVFELTQQSARGRVDDSAADSSPTWIAALNTGWTQDTGATFRIRFLVQETGAGTLGGTFGGRLQYNLAGGGWNNVTSTSPIQAAAGAVTDGRATGQVLGAGTNVAGEYDEVDGNVANISLSGDDETEVEYNLTIDAAQVTDAQTFQLRVTGKGDDTTDLDAWAAASLFNITVNEVVAAVLVQDKFRGRYDDGSETTANWIDAVDTNFVMGVGVAFRIRFNIRETATASPSVSPEFQLQYNLASGGWNDVTGASSVVQSIASSNFADGDNTTEQLAGAGTFTAGKMEESDGKAAAITMSNQDTEVEFSVQILAAGVTDGQTLQLRVVNDAGGADAALDTYTVTPTITVAELSTPTQLSHTEFPNQNSFVGPFETGTSKRTFMVDQGGHFLVCMEATTANPVDADWGLEDTATFVGDIECVYCSEDSAGDIQIVTMQTTGRVAYHVFDTGTGLWTVESENVANVGDTNYDDLPSNYACAITSRSGVADVVAIWRVDDGGVESVMCAERNGGSWTVFTAGTVAGDGGLVAGHEYTTSTGEARFFSQDGTTMKTVHQADGGTTLVLGSAIDSAVDTATNLVGTVSNKKNTLTDNFGLYIDAINQASMADIGADSIEATDISLNTVEGNGVSTPPYAVMCATWDNDGNIHLIYADDTTQDIHHAYLLSADTFSGGNETELVDAVTCNRISCRFGTGTLLHYVYENGSTVTYGQLETGEGTIDQLSDVTFAQQNYFQPPVEV